MFSVFVYVYFEVYVVNFCLVGVCVIVDGLD